MWKKLASVFVGVCILLSFSIHVSAATYLWPVPGVKYISCYYGNGHAGIDIAANGNHEIVAAREGTVIAAASTSCTHINNAPNACCNWGMGNYVQIKHSDGSYATYMHMKYGSVTVSKGQYVSRGTKIGMMGSSGNSTGQHLHFQVGYSSSNTINVNPDSLGYDYSNSSDPLGNPVNVGNEFYSYIVKYDSWKLVTYDTACNVFLQSNYGNPNQVWHFQRQSDGSYKITNLYDNTALEVQYEDKKSGANIATHEWWGGDCQKWYIYGTPGKYKLRAKHTEYVMDVTSNSNEDGTNIVTYKFNDTGAQNFHLNWVDVKPATLNAEVGTSSKETVFTWSGATFASIYDLKIWNGTYWVGDPYHIQWGAEGGVLRILLPAGHYEAYIDTRHGKTIEMSNVVSFDVARAAPVGAVISMDKTYYALGDTINMYFSYIDADSVSIGIKKDGIAFAQPDVTGKSDYSFIAESTGVYTAYLSAWNPAGYIDSKTITFTVFDNSVPINMKSNISVQDDYYDVNTEIENLFCPAVYSVASYDSFGRPLDIKAKNISAGTIDVVLALPWKKNSAYIKVYLWDSLGNMQPLCEPVIVD